MAVISSVKTTSQSKTKQIIAITLSVVSLILFTVFLAMNSNKTKEAEVYQPTINEKAYNESSKPKEKVSEPETTIVDDENITEDEPEVNKNETSTKIEYIKVDIQTIIDELDANALKAERTYQDMYVEITGKIKSFDSDGKYFSVEALNAGDWNFDSIQVYIANEEQRNILMKCSVGKEVTIQGQITDIGELIGYKMKADNIIADVPENDTSIDLTTNNSGYVEVDVQKLIDDLKNNALLAERTYQNVKVQVTGKISNIDSDGKYISIEALNAGDWNFDTIRCDISNDNQLDVIIEKSKGAEVTIRGQITDIGELLGYVIDIDEIW